jgi:DNA (cytosine-5)-methyltransferase 1
MNGFTSAYKRMSWDKPASALTRNLSYACSDHKLHPEQHRVLSLYEAFHLHTITDFDYKWVAPNGKRVSDKAVRDVIGESIPPRALYAIYGFLLRILENPNSAEGQFVRGAVPAGGTYQPDLFSALASSSD